MSALRKEITLPKLRVPRLRTPSPPEGSPSRPGRFARRPGQPSRGRGAPVTGLEIGATQAIAAQSRLQGGRVVAERVAARSLPLGLMRDGVVTEPERLARELRELFAEHRLPRRVRVGLATPRTVLRVIDLPPLEERDVKAALLMQAQERIPMPLDRAVMDFHTVGLVETPEGQRLRVIVVVTEREGVQPLLETLRGAGLKVEGIDLSIFAAIRALGGERPAAGPTLYAQLGDLVTIAIAESGVCRFTRQAPQGLAMVLDRLAESRAVPAQEVRALLSSLQADRELDGEPAGDVRDVFALLGRTAAELGSELRAAAEFYSTQSGTPVTSGVVAGPLAPLPGFVDALAEGSGLELTCGEAVAVTPDALGGVDARLAAVATGLAVAKVHA